MPVSFKSIPLLLFAGFALSACGEGYEMVRTTEYLPYGNQRTAGSGVAYVRAKMLPKKEVVLEAVSVERQPKQMNAKVLDDLQEMFREKQKK